jgi:Fe-S-cluster containining protein
MDDDIWYQCQRCANCCRWPGFVKITEAEVAAIAHFLGLAERDFIERHTRLRPNRAGLALLEKGNGECVFLDENACAIQPVKPLQCRQFPNGWNFPGWREVCEAIPVPAREPTAAARLNSALAHKRVAH